MFLAPWSCLLQKEMKMITTLLVYFTDSKHNVIRSHFFLNGHITIAIAGLSISGSILLPSSLMMPLFHAHSSSPTTLSVPVTANSHQFPAIYVCIEILDYMFHLLYPSRFQAKELTKHRWLNHLCLVMLIFVYIVEVYVDNEDSFKEHEYNIDDTSVSAAQLDLTMTVQTFQ